jgi:hypothetical protein
MNSRIDQDYPRFLNVRTAAEFFRWPIGGLRWLIFNAQANGLERALVRVGRKVLIDREEFVLWLNSHRTGGQP